MIYRIIYKSLKIILNRMIFRALPPGTRRQRKDGLYEKQSDGKWLKVIEKKPEEKKEKPAKMQKVRNHRIPENEEYNEQFAINNVTRDFKEQGINNPELVKNTIQSIHNFSLNEYSQIRAAYKKIDDPKNKDEYTEKARLIENYINIAPKFNGKVFRGIGVDNKSFERYLNEENLNNTINMNGMASWTSNQDVADKFIDEVGKGNKALLFKVANSKKGIAISHLSNEPMEKEVLFSGKNKYRIKKVKVIDEDMVPIFDEETGEHLTDDYIPKTLEVELEEI